MSNSYPETTSVTPADGKLAILIPGMGGAVATTFMAGVLSIRRGLSQPIGSLTQLQKMPGDPGGRRLHELLGLASLDDIVFGGWDIDDVDAFEAARNANVLSLEDLQPIEEQLRRIRPMRAVFSNDWVRNLHGDHVKSGDSKLELTRRLIADIRRFLKQHDCNRAVSIFCASTEAWTAMDEVHLTRRAFERGLAADHPGISPTMMYAYALLEAGVPFFNGTPNRAVDTPALQEVARQNNVVMGGRDFKTGQTLMKTVIGPGLEARKLGVAGWYSTNILGNRDGEVLNDPDSFRSKEATKLSVLESIFSARDYPELYSDVSHKVRIDYYPPRGDNKEGWDNIDFVGWMDYPMQIKVNLLCRDSILAAPVALDLALFADLAQRCHFNGVQEWLAFYFKSPQTLNGEVPVHDLFKQRDILFDKVAEIAQLIRPSTSVVGPAQRRGVGTDESGQTDEAADHKTHGAE
jgi:myo-inositol-1-phosphate synthase